MFGQIKDFLVEAYTFPNSLDWYIRLINWASMFSILLPFMQAGQGVYFLGAFLSGPFMLYAFIGMVAISILEPIFTYAFWAPIYRRTIEIDSLVQHFEEQYSKLAEDARNPRNLNILEHLSAQKGVRSQIFAEIYSKKSEFEIEGHINNRRFERVVRDAVFRHLPHLEDIDFFNERLREAQYPVQNFFKPSTMPIDIGTYLFLGVVTFSVVFSAIFSATGLSIPWLLAIGVKNVAFHGCLLGTVVGGILGIVSNIRANRYILWLRTAKLERILRLPQTHRRIKVSIKKGQRPAQHSLLPSLLDIPFLVRAFILVLGGVLFSSFILGWAAKGALVFACSGVFIAAVYPFLQWVASEVLKKIMEVPNRDFYRGHVDLEPIPRRAWWKLSRFDIPTIIHFFIIVGIAITQIPLANPSGSGIIYEPFAQKLGEMAVAHGMPLLGLSPPIIGFLLITLGVIFTRLVWSKLASRFFKEEGSHKPADHRDEVDSWSTRAFIGYFVALPAKFVIETHIPQIAFITLPLYIALPALAIAWPHIKDLAYAIKYYAWDVRRAPDPGNLPKPPDYRFFHVSQELPGFYHFRFGLFAGSQIVATILMCDPTLIGPWMALLITGATGLAAQLTPYVMVAFHQRFHPPINSPQAVSSPSSDSEPESAYTDISVDDDLAGRLKDPVKLSVAREPGREDPVLQVSPRQSSRLC